MNIEQTVIAKMLQTNDFPLFASVSESNFHRAAHRNIYKLIKYYVGKHHKLPSFSILEELVTIKIPEAQVGAYQSLLLKLKELNIPDISSKELTTLLHEKTILDTAGDKLERLIDSLEERDIETVRSIIASLHTTLNIGDKLPKPASAVTLKEDALATIPPFLPTMQSNGMYLGGVVVISGDSGAGKSTFGLNQIAYSIQNGIKTALINMELSETESLVRLYSCIHGKDFAQLYSNFPIYRDDIEKWKDTTDYMQNLNIISTEYDQHELEGVVRASALMGNKLIVIDYLGLTEIKSGGNKDWAELANLVKALHRLALELGVVILTFTQVNIHEVKEEDNKVILTPRGSRELIFSATLFLHIHITAEEQEENLARIFTVKARNAKKLTYITETDFAKMRFNDTGAVL